MKRHFLSYMFVFIVFLLAATMAAAGKDDGCKLQGTWMSFDENGVPGWVAGIHGQSASCGTNELEYPAFMIPGFSDVVGGTNMRGVWERTGGNTFDYTMFGYTYDEFGTPVWMNRMYGTLTLTDDCNTATVTATVNILFCFEPFSCSDPYRDPDIDPEVTSPAPSTAYRMMVVHN